CFCIGTSQMDLDAAERLGIPVFNAPYSNTRSVAELVVAEAIMLMRGIPRKNAACHRGGWEKSAAGSHEARGKTIGIVGYGHIGTQVGLIAENLGMRVLFHDIEAKLALGNARPVDSLDSLLEQSDVVTLHV
ncbi:NAD(P)-dependent oxidoreductase, partial [Lysobacter sp. D1-1-M9]|uniref:NAD(P)-dependent oxidoreductase n=1 Tax=Novilysobacter longmucuonensis TaxID=3098603 RepID=UPI002FC6B23C